MNLEDRSQAYLDQRLQVKTVPSSNQSRNAVSLTDDMTFFASDTGINVLEEASSSEESDIVLIPFMEDARSSHVSNLHDLTMKTMRYSTDRITV